MSTNTLIIAFFALCAACALAILSVPGSYDNTDPPARHSGMLLLTDATTGCQYLYKGHITPRIAADGVTHLGCKGAKP